MQENQDFSARYKQLIDGSLTPDPVQDEEMRKTIMLLMFSREPPIAGGQPADSGPSC